MSWFDRKEALSGVENDLERHRKPVLTKWNAFSLQTAHNDEVGGRDMKGKREKHLILDADSAGERLSWRKTLDLTQDASIPRLRILPHQNISIQNPPKQASPKAPFGGEFITTDRPEHGHVINMTIVATKECWGNGTSS
ncbi:hypothetical protein R3P38DRAFT_2768391 [Favolaschia claudopus]|uniref:Uncharacterized protein n=1 Tax=Favolaschia claudopus TaxID=2862362 RepID=A0AAW0CSD8_9AGAR